MKYKLRKAKKELSPSNSGNAHAASNLRVHYLTKSESLFSIKLHTEYSELFKQKEIINKTSWHMSLDK
jgi:hypothetical protein